MNPRKAFTLIELMMAVVIATIVVGVVSGVVFQIRTMSERVTARLAMARRSALVHAQLMRRVTATAPGQALVAEWKGGRLRLLFMRGVLDNNDWNYVNDTIGNGTNTDYSFWPTFSTDQVWELWEWSRDDHVLRSATSRVMRKFWLDSTAVGGSTYNDNPFVALPQPHRTLQAATWRSELNANLLFPNYSGAASDGLAGRRGLADGDIGDWTELTTRLVPVLAGEASERQVAADPATWDGVVDFALQIERVDGSVIELNPDLPDQTIVIQGARCDGLTTGAADATAPGARPSLLKLCWTLRDRRTRLSLPFSYSIPFPAFGSGQ